MVSSPSLMALTEAGPQQKTPERAPHTYTHTLRVSRFHTHTGPRSPQQSAGDRVKFKSIKLKPWIIHSVAAAKAVSKKMCLFQLLWEDSKSPSLVSCGVGSLVCQPSKSEPKSGRVIQLSTQTWKFLTVRRKNHKPFSYPPLLRCILLPFPWEPLSCGESRRCALTRWNRPQKWFHRFRRTGFRWSGWNHYHELIQS